jgi:hypothetical protein
MVTMAAITGPDLRPPSDTRGLLRKVKVKVKGK